MKDKTKRSIFRFGVSLLPYVALFGIIAGMNRVCNNRHVVTKSHETYSHGTGFTGHIEYTRFSDGSQCVKTYPGIGHRLWDSELLQDFDGDGEVDSIRKNGAEWKFNRLSYILIKEIDLEGNEMKFEKANKKLQELMVRYPISSLPR